MAFRNFEDLEVWRRSLDLSIEIYRLLAGCKTYSLKDQLERSALSVPSNIAEGQERDSPKEFVRFLRIAKGSCGEMRTQLYVARKLGLIPEDRIEGLIQETIEISAMLQGLIRSIHQPT